MQLADFLCYIVLMITVTATCARSDQHNKELEESQDVKRISKRDATILVDFNNNAMDKIFQRPKVIYRRISQSRFGPPKTKFGSFKSNYDQSRPRNRPHKPSRKPGKKGRTGKPKSSSSKYEPYKKRAQKNKPKYGAPQFRPNGRPGFGHIVKMPHYSFLTPYSASGFGEPPTQHVENQLNKNAHTEPPVDSYGAPLKPTIGDVYSTPFSAKETSQAYNFDDYKTQENPWNLKHSQSSFDANFAFTKDKPVYSNFVTPTPKDTSMDSLDPIADKQIMQDIKFFYRKKRPFYFADSKVMNVNRPWKPNKASQMDDEIVVGGQYAEPPARYVAKFNQNSPVYDDDDDDEALFPALQGYVDPEVPQSAFNSAYSNYRHSNMAFSPQNLNDVFSLVDK